ncbi:trace amine-associated receptor 1-like [Acipenser ruthenus]|uniref:trace amine-associated receptor 1-like n=1 Tax=Acipenser ruthenus TaxID=7906 RepID=UPI00145AE471|nr:trace amine-associated receptor 1-like [Acipenser ruthenus]
MDFSQSRINESTQFCYESVSGSCPKPIISISMRVAKYIFLVTAIALTVCGNLFVIISIAHFKQLHTPTNYLTLSLAVADFLLGGFIMPPSMIRSVESCWYFGDFFCKVHTSTDIMLSTASILHLSFISIDRYYAVCYPLRYKTTITVFVTLNMIFISWTVSAIVGFGMVFLGLNIQGIEDFYYKNFDCVGGCILIQSEASSMVSSFLSFYIPGLIMIGIYLKIFLVARRQARSIRDTEQQRQNTEEKKNTTANKRERKAAKTLGTVMGVFLISWLPFFLFNIMDPFFNYSTPPLLVDALVWFGYLNSTLNPFVYAFFYSWFRKALRIIALGKVFQNGSSRTKLFDE